jgi:hypothetical protein
MLTKKLIYLIILIVSISFVSANLGCFLYQESDFYCNDLTKEEALEECSFFDDCDLNKVFSSLNSCGNTEEFPQCTLAICKDSCQKDFVGKCQQGTVPEDQKKEWCFPGCCRFVGGETKTCELKNSKWLCAISADNKEVNAFNYDISLNKQQCENYCSQQSTTISKISSLEKENTHEALSFKEYVLEVDQKNDQNHAIESSKEVTNVEGEKSKYNSFIFIVIIFVIAVIGYLAYQKFKGKPKSLPKIIPKNTSSKKEDLINALTIKDLRKLAKIEEHKLKKIKDKRREHSLLELGLLPLKEEKQEFSKLRNIFHNYLKLGSVNDKKITEKEKKDIEKLSELVKSKNHHTSSKKVSNKPRLTKKEIDEIISGLRRISKK